MCEPINNASATIFCIEFALARVANKLYDQADFFAEQASPSELWVVKATEKLTEDAKPYLRSADLSRSSIANRVIGTTQKKRIVKCVLATFIKLKSFALSHQYLNRNQDYKTTIGNNKK